MVQVVLFEKSDGIALVTLNRPERLNALNEGVFAELRKVWRQVQEDSEVRVVVLTGAGSAFSTGADIKADEEGEDLLQETNTEVIRRRISLLAHEVAGGLRRLPMPTIAMVNGIAMGVGLELAMACDMRVASRKARFSVGFTRVGLVQPLGAFWLMPRIIGLAKTAELLFTGDFLEAEEAERIGLVNKVVPHEDLNRETMTLARKIANGPEVAIRLDKLMLYKGLEINMDSALELSAAYQAIAFGTDEFRERLQALREKRPPVFRGMPKKGPRIQAHTSRSKRYQVP